MKKTACFTIDIEPDFGGKTKIKTYHGLRYLPRLKEIVEKYNLKVTAFVTGKTLEDNPDLVDLLNSMNMEIEQHSYAHKIGHDSKIDDMKKGLEVHEKIIGKPARGYRAPQGEISKEEAVFLEENGVLYDSSIFPTYFPGRYNRLSFPIVPFKIGKVNLIEIPLSVIPKVRIPIGFGYVRFLGLNTFKTLFRLCGMPQQMVIDFHSYEFGSPSSYNELPIFTKIVQFRGQKLYRNQSLLFENFVKYILSKGYESKYMIDVFNEEESKAKSWDWENN